MLVVDPASRGGGLGWGLTEECIDRARRGGSPVIALHTSPIISVALPMYLGMGFRPVREAGPTVCHTPSISNHWVLNPG
jgi:GNAT superfamily N-acetyltransferase